MCALVGIGRSDVIYGSLIRKPCAKGSFSQKTWLKMFGHKGKKACQKYHSDATQTLDLNSHFDGCEIYVSTLYDIFI